MATLNLQVGANADDICVYWTGSAWVIESGFFGNLTAGFYGTSWAKIGSGIRFQNVTIPPGSTITQALLTLTSAANVNGGTLSKCIIRGDKEANCAAFSTLADYQARRGTVVGGADNSKLTSASVGPITMQAQTTDATLGPIQTQELKAIIQEIINLSGWASGNALALFWDDHDDNSSHISNYRRSVYQYESSASKAAKLAITYTLPPGGAQDVQSKALLQAVLI